MPPQKVTVTFPAQLVSELEQLVKETGYWLSVVDFIRESTVEKLERWKREHPAVMKALAFAIGLAGMGRLAGFQFPT